MARIVDLNKENEIFPESVIGLGNFDGIHYGHQNIVKKVKEIAKDKKVKSSVLVFKQHTNEVFPHFPRFYISSLDDKIEIFSKLGIDIVFIIDFTLEFAQLNNEEFILGFIRDRLNAHTVICGQDYTFGKKSLGTVKELLEYKKNNKLDVVIQEYILHDYKKISSTTIREFIENGQVDKVSRILGTNYKIKGKVIHGFKIGAKELGYPTANIELAFKYIIPEEGVYLTFCYYNGQKYLSLTSIGTNPTVTDNRDIKIETYIIDFNNKIYGEDITIEFIEKIRNQIKFDSKEELINQMDEDLRFAIDYRKNNL